MKKNRTQTAVAMPSFSKAVKNYLFDNNINFPTVRAALLLLFLYAANGFGQTAKSDYFAHLKPAHAAAAVKNYIDKNANLRPAQISDCKNKFGLDSLRQTAGKSAHPYYAVADFNQDKIADFAVVLYDSKKASDARFTVLIFDGAKSGAYKLARKTENADLREGGIWTNGFGANDGKATITAGVFETDDCFWIEWDGKKYVTRECAEVEN